MAQSIRLDIDLEAVAGAQADLEKGFATAGLQNGTAKPKKAKFEKAEQIKRLHFYSTRRREGPHRKQTVELISKEDKIRVDPNHIWLHIEDQSQSFEDFIAVALSLIGDDDGYHILVRDLLDRVRKTEEKVFVHGRYLRPSTAISQSKSFKDGSDVGAKRVTFFCIPYFQSQPPVRHGTDKHFDGFPIRSLIQSAYGLESTRDRDFHQVTASSSNDGSILHCPDVWALVIGKRTLITKSSTGFDRLRGDDMVKIPFPQSPRNSDLSAIQLTGVENGMYYIPVSQCLTFYEFISQIVVGGLDSALNDETGFFIIGSDKPKIDEQAWTSVLQAHSGSPLIRIDMRSSKEKAKRSIGSDAGQIDSSDEASDSTSSSFSSDPGTSRDHRSFDSHREDAELGQFKDMQHQLGDAYKYLSEARSRNDYESIYALEVRQIPALESKFLQALDKLYEQQQDVYPVVRDSVAKNRTRYRASQSRGDRQGMAQLRLRERYQRDAGTTFEDFVSRRGFSEIAEMTNIEVEDDTRLSRASDSTSDEQDRKLHIEETWARTPGRLRTRMEPYAQYVPKRASTRAVLQRLAPGKVTENRNAGGAVTYSIEIGELETPDLVSKAKEAMTEQVLHKSCNFIATEKHVVPFLTWFMGFKVHFRERKIDGATDNASPRHLESTMDIGTEDANIRMAIVLEELDSTYRQTKKGQSALGSRILYKQTPTSGMLEVQRQVEHITAVKQQDALSTLRSYTNDLASWRLCLFEVAKKTLAYFVPIDTESDLIAKYWAAIKILIESGTRYQLATTVKRMLGVSKLAQDLQSGALTQEGRLSDVYRLPRSLPNAFRDLILSVIFDSVIASSGHAIDDPTSRDETSPFKPHFFALAGSHSTYQRSKDYLTTCKQQIVDTIVRSKRRTKSLPLDMISGEDIAILALSNLQNICLAEQGDFKPTEMYTDYALKLQYNAGKKASVRTYDDINRFREEVDAVKGVLTAQLHRFRDLNEILFKSSRTSEAEKLAKRYEATPSLPNTIRHRTLEQLRLQTQQRLDSFTELQKQTDRIQGLVAQALSLKAESNNRAILIFTLVTIIFLPLSFVTSFFGMNTTDIRDIGSDQSIFWIVGIPLSVVVVISTLIIGYFERISRRISRMAADTTKKKIE